MSATPSTAELNNGDISWVIVSTALVFLMCPGLGFFYAGLARSKNALSLMYICILAVAVVSVQWYLFGYSLAFSETGSFFIGDFSKALMSVSKNTTSLAPTIPESLFMIYQMMPSAITPALALGAAAERISLGPTIIFFFVWSTFVYDVITYWVSAPSGWLSTLGVMDYAGGTAVHVNCGAAAVAIAMFLGKRRDYNSNNSPHHVTLVYLGLGLLWFGWYGFNAGSATAANARGVQALVNTHLAGCVGGLVWVVIDFFRTRNWSAVGFSAGAVAGLATITAGSGFVSSTSSLIFGLTGGIICNIVLTNKKKLGFDDALDVFPIHFVGGTVGLILTGILGTKSVRELSGDTHIGGGIDGNWQQVLIQLAAIAAASIWSFVITYLIMLITNLFPGLRLRLEEYEEEVGTDLAQMDEHPYGFMIESTYVYNEPKYLLPTLETN